MAGNRVPSLFSPAAHHNLLFTEHGDMWRRSDSTQFKWRQCLPTGGEFVCCGLNPANESELQN